MKSVIHLITTIERGGAEKQLLILAAAQVADGRPVSVIFLKGVPELAQDFKDAGVELILDIGNISPLKQVLKLRKILKLRSEYIIHAHLPRAELIACLAGLLVHEKIIFTRHNSEPFFPSAPKIVSHLLSRFVTRRSKLGIAISLAVKEYLLNSNEISKVFLLEVCYYGIPFDRHQVSTTKLKSKNAFAVGTISRLAPQKDLVTLILAFQLFQKNHLESELFIVGEGPLKFELEKLIRRLDLSDSVHLLGRLTKTSDFYQMLDVFVLSSLYEGFGLVLLEAMKEGIPVVATKISAIPEVLGGNHILLAEVGNPQSFANMIEKCIDEGIREKVLSHQIAQLSTFSVKNLVLNMNQIYNKLT